MDERTIFLAALEIDDPGQRAAYLETACRGDAELRQRVDQLLKSHESAGSFLQGQAKADEVTAGPPSPAEGPGTQIGPYKLLQQIGEGGMGVVYMAEQREPVKRRVALKIIKPGMDTAQVIARFEAERQALAMMDHPNIAKVLDAGRTESGRPFFVMELVKGVPITEFADQRKLTPQERLRLFVDVCRAVQHAHQKGIIHRDLKPSNVLVARFDDHPVVKVIDFGVAKATNQELTHRTLFTQFGQIVGTLEYMSPEQAQLNQLDIDTRTDIYALGVLLYELLTGETPFDKKRLRAAAFDEVLRIIRDEEPPRPSVRVRSSATLSALAENRQVDPKKLGSLIKGDLDWIVMKSLDKDRARRYETANGLADDVIRYLEDQPIVARPPSVAYRSVKFARRNKGLLSAVALIFLILLAGIAATTRMAAIAVREKRIADENAAELANTKEQLEDVVYDQVFLAILNGDILQCQEMLPQIANANFNSHKLMKLNALHGFFNEVSVTVPLERLMGEFEQGLTDVDMIALLAISAAWRGDTNLYYRIMQRLDEVGYEGASDRELLMVAIGEMTRNNTTALSLCERVVSRHPNWIRARLIECLCRGYVGLEEEDLKAVQAAHDLATAMRKLIPQLPLNDIFNFMTAFEGVVTAERTGTSPDKWIETAKKEAENLQAGNGGGFHHGCASFYEYIGDVKTATALWDNTRSIVAEERQVGSQGDAYSVETVAFFARQGRIADAKEFLRGRPQDGGPWTDLTRMVVNVLDSAPGWREANKKLIQRWTEDPQHLYPPFRIHLVNMALLAGDEALAKRLAQTFSTTQWPSRTHAMHPQMLSYMADLDDNALAELPKQCAEQGGLTLLQSGELYYHLGVYWMARGKRQAALECLEKVPRFGPFGYGCDYFFARPFAKKLKESQWPWPPAG